MKNEEGREKTSKLYQVKYVKRWKGGGGGEQLNVLALCHFQNGQSFLLLTSCEM